jgi:hypothetical protein
MRLGKNFEAFKLDSRNLETFPDENRGQWDFLKKNVEL